MKPRFTIRDLMIATALIAVGVGGLCAIARHIAGHTSPLHTEFDSWTAWTAVCASGVFIGVGVFFPFGRVWQGALWGFVFVNVLLLASVPILKAW